MKFWKVAAASTVPLLMTACNGSNDSSSGSMTYDFIVPQMNSQRSYAETIIDNSNNSIKEMYSETVTAVNSDNSYVLLQEGTTGSNLVNGTSYSIPTETVDVNDQGRDTSYSYTNAAGAAETCTYSPYGPGPAYPLSVGGTWTTNYTVTCGTATPVNHTQTGAVVDVESVTVPAGTFTAVKLQSTDEWTDVNGTTITQTAFNWRDVDTTFSVQRTITRAYSGTLPTNGYEVTAQVVLQSTN